jgi:predicted aspartyl protease
VRTEVVALALAAALVALAVVAVGLAGVALLRDANPIAATLAAIAIAAAPPLGVAAAARRPALPFAAAALCWSALLLAVMPVYFPHERPDDLLAAVLLGEIGDGSIAIRRAADGPPLAEALPAFVPTTVERQIGPDQISLHYEGDGRRMTVEVGVQHRGVTRDLHMLLDTGATFTTLDTATLTSLGLAPGPEAPRITLQTAGGEREASLLLLDGLWLGDLSMDGVAIATCDACASGEVAGLLGLNVTGGYNLTIDADAREVVFTRRADYSRHLDIKPFVEIGATIQQIGDRVRARPFLENRSGRAIERADIALRCNGDAWIVPLGPVLPGERVAGDRRLPAHAPCDRYQVALHAADW